LSVFIIWLVSGILCYIAVERIVQEHYKDVKPNEMLITASLGVVINFIMGFVLHSEICCGHAHSHNKFGHGHSHNTHSHSHNTHSHNTHSHNTHSHNTHSHNTHKDRSHHQKKNINVRAAFIHVVGDIIQSIGVLVAALIIKFTDPKFRLADPICTFLFSLLVLVTTVAVLRDTLLVMMEAVPRDISVEEIRRDLAALPGVVAVHRLHVWALTLDRNALSVHLAI
ncbi:hypothetical protein EGW08_021977, partial [Elysia chlorotica]